MMPWWKKATIAKAGRRPLAARPANASAQVLARLAGEPDSEWGTGCGTKGIREAAAGPRYRPQLKEVLRFNRHRCRVILMANCAFLVTAGGAHQRKRWPAIKPPAKENLAESAVPKTLGLSQRNKPENWVSSE